MADKITDHRPLVAFLYLLTRDTDIVVDELLTLIGNLAGPGPYEFSDGARAMTAQTLAARLEAPAWQPIEMAPKDGTVIIAWCVHVNAEFSKDPVGEGWSCPVVAQWIDHNGGGWTWHGLCGTLVAWMPAPAPPVA